MTDRRGPGGDGDARVGEAIGPGMELFRRDAVSQLPQQSPHLSSILEADYRPNATTAHEEPFVRLSLRSLIAVALVLISLVLATPVGAAGDSYSLTDLGTLGGSFSLASKVSDRG